MQTDTIIKFIFLKFESLIYRIIIISLITIILCITILKIKGAVYIPQPTENVNTPVSDNSIMASEFNYYSTYYNWLTTEIYFTVRKHAHRYNVPIDLVLAIIDVESGGRNIRSNRRNSNGSYDYGIMQINDVHLESDKFNSIGCFFDLDKNIEFGVIYMRKCMDRSYDNKTLKYDIPAIIRRYNQGLNGNENNYNNWRYVVRVYDNFVKTYLGR